MVTAAAGATMPPKVKKVMIPPMVRKAGGAPAGGAPITVTKGGVRIPGKSIDGEKYLIVSLPKGAAINDGLENFHPFFSIC